MPSHLMYDACWPLSLIINSHNKVPFFAFRRFLSNSQPMGTGPRKEALLVSYSETL